MNIQGASLPSARGLAAAWLCAGLLALGLAVANTLLGNLNHDEGWYLLAALRTARGQFPYRDFLFTQGPLMPAVYGALSPFWAPFGVLGGRILTALLGLAATALTARLAMRWSPPARRREAGLTACLLTACAPVHSYFTTIPKTYSLTALLLVGGFLLRDRPGRRAALGSGLLLGLAAATRHSALLALPVAGLGLLAQRGVPQRRGAWLAFGVGGLAALAATYGVAALLAGGNLAFALGYHAVRAGDGVAGWLALRAGFVSRALQAYPLAWLLAAGLAVARMLRAATWRIAGGPAIALATVAAVTALHGLSPFPYDDYQTPIMPLFAAAIAALLWQSLNSVPARVGRAAPALLAVAALVLAVGSPLLMEWAVIRKDRFWFQRKSRPDLLVLRDAGRWVRAHTPPGSLLLTQDAYLAVEARRDVPAGLEMGPFSLFPALSDAAAARRRVHNVATLRRLIATGAAPMAATSGYTFAVDCPSTAPLAEDQRAQLFATLAEWYAPVHTIPDFGQAHTPLTLWRRRTDE